MVIMDTCNRSHTNMQKSQIDQFSPATDNFVSFSIIRLCEMLSQNGHRSAVAFLQYIHVIFEFTNS